MTAVSAYNNTAALLILQQANSVPTRDDEKTSATDRLIETVNRISSETSGVQTQASAKINSALLDMMQETDGIVSSALDFIDSDSFKASDPDVKATLKALIADNGAGFAAMVKQEQAKHPGTTLDNAIHNAITYTIKNNRAAFTNDEFVIGSKFSNGGIAMTNIADINGNSTSTTLRAAFSKLNAATVDAYKALMAWTEGSQQGPAPQFPSASAWLEAADASSNWTNSWLTQFGWSQKR